jgi:hypothetical protein
MNPEKQLIVDVITFEPQKQSLTESLQGSGPFTVKGILQRAEVKNQNGRSYPFSILQREVEKYNETFVKERRALGELDHPACISFGDIMTYEGWKDIKDVKIGELIPTLNTTTNSLEYNPIERVINDPYKGKMISFKGKSIDILVTPNHRFILNDRYGNFLEKTAQEILELSYTNKFPHLSIPIVADNWNGKSEDGFVLQWAELDFESIKEEVDYDSRVYCVTVKNGTFYCRNNNKCFWSGNSEIVNLKNVSHNVIDLNWEGKDLIGTLEILSTPSGNILKELFKSNIRVGISSRGVGTLKKLAEGTEQVQDDFSLISFDVVSTPSTRGSFLFPTNNIQLQENVILNPVNSKWVTAESIIQDIFSELN